MPINCTRKKRETKRGLSTDKSYACCAVLSPYMHSTSELSSPYKKLRVANVCMWTQAKIRSHELELFVAAPLFLVHAECMFCLQVNMLTITKGIYVLALRSIKLPNSAYFRRFIHFHRLIFITTIWNVLKVVRMKFHVDFSLWLKYLFYVYRTIHSSILTRF